MDFAYLGNLLFFFGVFGAVFGADLSDDDDDDTQDTTDQDPLYVAGDYAAEESGTDEADTATAGQDNLAWFLQGGNDTLTGSAGNDYANLGEGDDRATMGAGNDIVMGFDGNDQADLGQGNDIARGGEGNDSLFGQSGGDVLQGDEGDDSLMGGSGADLLSGGDGNDFLSGFETDASGAAGLLGAEGADILRGGNGDDTLLVGRGDEASGGSGEDSFLLDNRWSDSTGAFHITDYTQGQDQIGIIYTPVYSAETSAEIPPTIALETTADGATLVRFNGSIVAQLDGVTGLTLDDIALHPDTAVDPNYNAGRFEEHTGTDGADSFAGEGTAANSWLTGGGNDTISAGTSAGDYARLGEGGDSANLGEGNDTIRGEAGNDTIDAGEGSDSVLGGEGNDSVSAGAGTDRVFGERGDDQLNGGDGADSLFGGAGNDTISGYAAGAAGSDGQTAADGTDILSGGDGDDTLIIGRGDIATGGAGSDSFVMDNRWSAGTQTMTISDWDAETDSLTLQYTPTFDENDVEIPPVVTVVAGPGNAYAIIQLNGTAVAQVTGAASTLQVSDITLERAD